ncbi:hypothetical protein GCM10009741_53100 [Kribbella lupini]|uniref:Uncharacterized protein n=1 Tax=Kribbella lupini TaxID=291602 RepID=A0ABP4MF87_9ACTN
MTVVGAQSASARAVNVTNVQVVWADAKQHSIRITWTESQPAANTIVLRSDAGEGGNEFGHTTADQPNEYVVDAATLGPRADPADKVWIEVGDGSGTPGRTDAFDRFNYGGSPVTTAFEADGSLRWTVAPDTSIDPTPGDPLDRPQDYTYVPQQRVRPDRPIPGCDAINLAPTTARTGTIPDAGYPYNLLIGVDNEWGTVRFNLTGVGRTKSLTMTGPAATKLGEKTTLTGVLNEEFLFEASGGPPSCSQWPEQTPNQSVVIQQRTSATAPWTTAGTTRTTGEWGAYTAVLTNPGHREYRAVRLNTIYGGRALYGGVGGVKSVRATTRVVSAKFIQPVINLGTRPQAYLWVDPAGTQRTALQFKNAAGAWQGVAYKTLYAGRGLLAFPWNKRGTTQFRWWVPATTAADAAYSNTFTLTVR